MPTASGTNLNSMSSADLVSALNGGGSQGSTAANPFTNAIGTNESNNASDTAAIVNPASGARGSMQVMPKTAVDPGFGVTPSNGTPQDDARMGRDYYNALNARYGDPTTAAIAYNWGPGKTDKWLAAGADPSKLPAETLAYATNFNQNTGQGQGGGQSTPQAPQSASAQFDQFVKGLPNNGQGNDTDKNPIVAFGAGLGRGLQQTALGAQSLVGKGLTALGSDTVGPWLTKNAAQGDAQGAQDYSNAAGDTISGKVGQAIGGAAPAMMAGPEVLPQVLAGAEFGAGNAALNNQNILPGAVEGAGFGAAGSLLGQGVGALAAGAKPLITKALSAANGGEATAARGIGNAIGADDLESTIANLRNNSDQIIPGSNPTAAEAANNPAVARIQRQMQNTEEGQAAFPARQAENNDARMQAGQNAVGPSDSNSQMMGPGLDAQAEAFTRLQAQRVASGQAEVQPISDAQAQLMQTPAYQRAITAARQDAQNAGIDSFETQSQAVNQGLSDQIDNLAGTPDTLEGLRGARRAQAETDYAPLDGQMVNANTPQFADLEARPGFRQAYRDAAGLSSNLEGANAADPFVTVPGHRSFGVNSDGTLAFTEGPAQRFADAGMLQRARSSLSQMENAARSSGNADTALGYQRTREALDAILGDEAQVGSDVANTFRNARANYAANSVPIDQQQLLQTRLASAVNNLTGEVNPSTLNSTINGVARDQLKPGLRPADRITPDQLAELQNIGQQAREAGTNMRGLDARGQELIRQQLETAAQGGKPGAAAARDALNAKLAGESPSYAAMQEAAQTIAPQLASRQALADALAQWSRSGHNAVGDPVISLNNARQALNNPALTGIQSEYAANLLADLQRASTANASLGAAGSQTAANQSLGGGIIDLLSHKFANGAIGGAAATGHFGTAAMLAVGNKILTRASVNTEKAAIDLLLNPKKLANALEKYAKEPTDAQAFIAALKNKAARGGKAGAAAIQAYEAAQAQNQK